MSRLARFAWTLVVAAALALSWWSLFSMAHDRFRLPVAFAAIVSVVFDGCTIVAADRTLRNVRDGYGPGAGNLLTIAAMGLSAYLNWSHAVLADYPTPGCVMFTTPPIVAGALLELELRGLYRDALRRLGRDAPPLPAYGKWVVALHPKATFEQIRAMTQHRLDSIPVNVIDWRPAAGLGYSVTVEAQHVLDTTPLPARVPVDEPPAVAEAPETLSIGQGSGEGTRVSVIPEYTEQPKPEYVPEYDDVARPGDDDAVPDESSSTRLPAPAETWRRAVEVHRESVSSTGKPPSIRQLKSALGVGQTKATELRAALVEHVNGVER